MSRLRAFSRRAFLTGLATVGGGLALGYVTTPKSASDDGKPISCPFLAMGPPDTTNMWSFARGCEANGMSYSMAILVSMQVTYFQKGLLAVLRHEAPDIYRLHEVPGISHEDKYWAYKDDLRPMADEMAVDGFLTLQNLVELKEWVARDLGVTPNDASRIETALLFVRAGGDFETWTVGLEDVFLLISRQRPKAEAEVTMSKMNEALEATQWTL
jgi:hypothetical protein